MGIRRHDTEMHGNNELLPINRMTYLPLRTAYVLRLLGKILFVIDLSISGSCQSIVYRSVLEVTVKHEYEFPFLLWLYIQDLTWVVILTLVIYTGSYMSCHSYFGYIYRILHELSFTINFYETSYIKLTTNVYSLLSSDPNRHTTGYAES